MKPIFISLSLLPLFACSPENEEVDLWGTPEATTYEETQTYEASEASKASQAAMTQAEDRLQKLESELELMKEALADKKEDTTENWEELMATLEEKRKVAAEYLGELKEASADAWETTKVRVEAGLDDFEASVAEAWERIRN